MYIDAHLDTVFNMHRLNRTFYERNKEGHIDLPRAREGKLIAGLFTGYPNDSQYLTDRSLRRWINLVNDDRNCMKIIKDYKTFENLLEHGLNDDFSKIGNILHFEGAAGIDSELNRLYIFYEVGLRSMSLTWNEENIFATGAEGDKTRGLTAEGINLLSAMEDLGIIIDVSHLNDKSFWDVVNNTNQIIFASHSNIRYIADHKRNLTKEMIEAIVNTDGSIGINFHKPFLSSDNSANINTIIAMIEEVINKFGIKHVHIGSDMDGAHPPDDFKDVTDMPKIFQLIKDKLELTDNELAYIQYKNLQRIIKKSWKT